MTWIFSHSISLEEDCARRWRAKCVWKHAITGEERAGFVKFTREPASHEIAALAETVAAEWDVVTEQED